MGRLVLTKFNNKTGKVEQKTIHNVRLTVEYIDEFGRRVTLLDLFPTDYNLIQKSYVITEITDIRLIEGIDYKSCL